MVKAVHYLWCQRARSVYRFGHYGDSFIHDSTAARERRNRLIAGGDLRKRLSIAGFAR